MGIEIVVLSSWVIGCLAVMKYKCMKIDRYYNCPKKHAELKRLLEEYEKECRR